MRKATATGAQGTGWRQPLVPFPLSSAPSEWLPPARPPACLRENVLTLVPCTC